MRIILLLDREYAKLIEVDIRLAKADFGDDYVPVEPSYKFRSDFYLNTTLTDTVKEQIQTLEHEDSCDNAEEPLPVMRMDVLGLNHTDIMTKVCIMHILIFKYKLFLTYCLRYKKV